MPRSPRRYSFRVFAAVSDHSGRKVPVGFVKHNGRRIVTVPQEEARTEPTEVHASDDTIDRVAMFKRLAQSGRFTAIELRTIRALAFEHIALAGL